MLLDHLKVQVLYDDTVKWDGDGDDLCDKATDLLDKVEETLLNLCKEGGQWAVDGITLKVVRDW